MEGDLLGQVNWLAVIVALVWSMVLGSVWYNLKVPTGRVWAQGMGIAATNKPAPGDLLKGLILSVIGSALTMTVLAYLLLGMEQAYGGGIDWMSGVWGGFFVWLGFLVPVALGGLAWERRTVPFTLVNAGYHLLNLVGGGIILGALR